MKKIFFNRRGIILVSYILTLLLLGYFIGINTITKIDREYYFSNLTIYDIFKHNFFVTNINMFLAFLGGILSLFTISLDIVMIGFSIYETKVRLNTSTLNILIATLPHGIGEFIVMFMILNISIDFFIYWYNKIILNKDYSIRILLLRYIKILLVSIPILGISAFLEIIISTKMFEKIFMLGG
ncbi:stage II sporulation protein M [Clostridium perfringens]|uniref:stage II sporulation protein M n=1 Tax=Clostridium perfringens TaxID=1502 RepID=UPI0024BD456A|nr:stage II sporulation protein M [Clostridium perfringens]